MRNTEPAIEAVTATSARPLATFLAIAQFFLLLCWTVYAIYLPALLEQAGVGKQYAAWVLLADQLLFAVFDIAAGFAADRAFRAYARIGSWVLAATVVSSGAFLLLPWIAGVAGQPGWSPWVFLGLTGVWVISSAALRAPVFGLLSRHARKGESPRLNGIALLGMGLAAALSPYLGTLLKGADPRLPFALSSLALVLAAAGLVLAEQRYRAPENTPVSQESSADRMIPAHRLLPLILLAALAFQLAVNLNAAPRYLRDLSANALPWVMPVFWIGFSLSAFLAGRLCAGVGAIRILGVGCLAGAAGILLAQLPGAETAVIGYLLAGFGWGAALPAGFSLIAEAGRPNRVATLNGLLFSALALSALARIGINVAGVPQDPSWSAVLPGAPVLLWSLSGAMILLASASVAARKPA